ncbi:MAG: DUF2288 family protein [Myxococcota bacterium]|nr:DUF2288 family protein [Myxococcota bacterium]
MTEDNSSAVRAQLAADAGAATWSMLGAHAQRGGLLFVDPSLDLIDVAFAIAEDQSETVASWMEHGLLSCPTLDDIAGYAADTERQWPFVIVQPYVFVTGP